MSLNHISEIETLLEKSNKQRTRETVAYYPAFESSEDLTNHYHRALWYLPYLEGALHQVLFFISPGLELAKKPSYFGGSESEATDHLKLISATQSHEIANAQTLLIWKSIDPEIRDSFSKKGIRTFNIDTSDIDSIEYGNYCKILWTLLGRQRQVEELKNSRKRFDTLNARISKLAYEQVAVFGTGPSIEQAYSLDFSKTFTVACNTSIIDTELCEIINPDVITAGDVVSHFGVSKYAYVFREKLRSFLRSSNTFFITTAPFGFLFYNSNPGLQKQIILIEQKGSLPNCDLNSNFTLPCLDSTLNIHMFPVAFTFFSDVYVFGCDGKNPDIEKNEDFWAHSKRAQLHELVDTGHQSHPTFDRRRQQSSWERYKNSTQLSCDHAEGSYNKRVFTVTPSFTPGLKERLCSHHPF